MSEILRELERLSLVNKLCTELSNHFGSESEFVVDKDVAEFIIHIAEKNATIDTFTKELSENGAEFTETFIANIHRIIHSHLDRTKQRKDETPTANTKGVKLRDINGEEIEIDPSLIYRETLHEETKLKFPALCIRDDLVSEKKLLQTKEGDKNREVVQSTIMKLESLRKKGLELDSKNESVKKRDKDKSRHKERRHRERTYSRSPVKRRHRRSRSRSASTRHRGRDKNRDNSQERYHKYRTRSLTPLDNEPIIGSIYKGSVTGVLKYGCFVSLKGIKRKCEGLVHVSQLLGGGVRVSDPQEVVRRGDQVYAKVLSLTGDKVRLSMKEACQKTGNDLGHSKPDQLMLGGEIGRDVPTHNPEYNEEEVSNSAQRAWTGGGGRQRVRCSSPEKWELKQLVAAGVMELEDLPWYSEETGILRADCQDDSDEDIDIGESY